MNALIHLATGFGVALTIAEADTTNNKKIKTSILGLTISFVSHALLDYAPHCYPINSKVDFIVGAIVLFILVSLASKNYRLIIFSCLIGSVLPDIIDLLPKILNKQLNFNLPEYNNFFPWHWKEYSGSIYNSDCNVSNINIGLLLLCFIGIVYFKRKKISKIYRKSKQCSDEF